MAHSAMGRDERDGRSSEAGDFLISFLSGFLVD